MPGARTTEPAVEGEARRRSAPRAWGAFASASFRVYWLSALSFVLGFQVLRVALAWVVYDLTGSPIYLGAMGGVMAAGTLAVTLPGGVIADRVDRRVLLLTTQTLMTVLAVTLVALAALGRLEAWHLLVAAGAVGAIQGIDQPTRTAVIPDLIRDRRDLMSALALGSVVWQGTRIVGPALGGILLAAAGVSATFGVVAAGFAGGALLMAFLRLQRTERERRPVLREMIEGLAFIGRNRLFASLIGLTFVDSLFGAAYVYLLPIYARDILIIGASGMGLLMGVSAAGALTGTLSAALFVGGRWPRVLLLGGAAAFGVGVILFGLSVWLPLSLGVLYLAGAANALSLITNQTILQAAVPEALRGRVMGAFSLTYGLIPLGGLQAGAVTAQFGAPAAVVVGGVIVVLFSLTLVAQPGFGRSVTRAAAAAR
ncbi:MAG: MFS transporter [Chloroflexi bacterium]|nr:MFS transporter [Chloroflexota bacterium]